jgi:hypothetical protein
LRGTSTFTTRAAPSSLDGKTPDEFYFASLAATRKAAWAMSTGAHRVGRAFVAGDARPPPWKFPVLALFAFQDLRHLVDLSFLRLHVPLGPKQSCLICGSLIEACLHITSAPEW